MAIPSKSDRPGGASMTVAADAGAQAAPPCCWISWTRKKADTFSFTFPFFLLLHLKFRKSRFCSSFHSTLLPEQIFGGGRGEREGETCMGKFRWTEF